MNSDLLIRIKNLSICDILGHYIPLTRQGSRHVALCPFHDDTRPSLQVSEKKGFFKCFACGAGGDAITFVKDFKKIPFKEALIEIAEKFHFPVDELKAPRAAANPKYALGLRINKAALKIFRQCAQSQKYPEFAKFVRERGLSEEIVTQFALGYAPGDNPVTRYILSLLEEERRPALAVAQEIGAIRPSQKRPGEFYDTFRNRIIFPIWNRYDGVMGFGSRAIFDYQKGKYVNSQESFLFNKKYILYGLNFAKQSVRERGQVILVEGQMDCLALAGHGLPNAVAVMGVAIGPVMVKDLSKMAQDIVLGFDSDRAGLDAAKRANELFLREGLLPRYLDYTPHKDSDEFLQRESRLELMQKIEQAPAFLDLLMERELGENIPQNTDGKLARLCNIFDLARPLGKTLPATERIIEMAKRLRLQSTEQQILDSYQLHLDGEARATPSAASRPPPLPPTTATAATGTAAAAAVMPEQEFELSKTDSVILEYFAAYPECFRSEDHQKLLDYVSCHEVKRLVEFLKNVYLEVNEGHYPKMAQVMLEGEGVGSSAMSVIAGGLMRYASHPLGEERIRKLICDLHKKLQSLHLIQQRAELQKRRLECETDQEGHEYLKQINVIQQQLNGLKR